MKNFHGKCIGCGSSDPQNHDSFSITAVHCGDIETEVTIMTSENPRYARESRTIKVPNHVIRHISKGTPSSFGNMCVSEGAI